MILPLTCKIGILEFLYNKQVKGLERAYNCTHPLYRKALSPFIYGYRFAPNSEKGNVKEPKYLNIYHIISRIGNAGMLGDFLINILVVDFC